MVLVARVVLIGVFLVAGIAKLRDREGSRQAVRGFGAPAGLAAPIAWALVVAELATALALIVAPTAGGWAAVAFLSALAAIVGVTLAAGRQPECRCFGRLSRGRIGWSTVARNVGLVGVALLVASDDSLGLGPVAVAMAGLGVWAVALRSRPHEATSSPLDDLRRPGVPMVAVFSSPHCGPCQALAPTLARLHHEVGDQVAIVVVSNGAAVLQDDGGPTIVVDEHGLLFRQFDVNATPTAILVDTGEAAVGDAAIVAMVEGVAAEAGPTFSRRGMLSRAAQGMVALTALPAIAAACSTDGSKPSSGGGTTGTAGGTGTTPAGATQLEVDGAYLCNQAFALCTTAPCTPSKTDPTIADCDCVVINAWSVGHKSCAERAQQGLTLYSDFATTNVNKGFNILECPASAAWANCVDMPCTVDKLNPAKAVCACQLVETGPSFTFGGGCETSTCTETIWSGATAATSLNAPFSKGMQQLGQTVTIPPACPSGSTSGSTGTTGR